MLDIYALNWYANDYDQHGGYTLCTFTAEPTFADLKDVIESHLTDCEFALPPKEDATYGKLSRGETVAKRGTGHWQIDKMPIYACK